MTRPTKRHKPSGPSTPRALRNRPGVEITLPVDLLARLDALCREYGASRSGAVEGAIVLGLRSGELAACLAQVRKVAEA